MVFFCILTIVIGKPLDFVISRGVFVHQAYFRIDLLNKLQLPVFALSETKFDQSSWGVGWRYAT